MDRIVEEMKRLFPEKYKEAQKMGEELMSKDWTTNEVGVDKYGDMLKFEYLVRMMKNYGLTVDELSNIEKELYYKFNKKG